MQTASRSIRSIAALAAFALVMAGALGAGSASAAASKVVFAQTDNPAGNQIVAYDRSPHGTLTQAGTYATGGLGGVLEGSVADHLASQGSLTYDRRNGLLYSVNGGSNTISVFAVFGDRLALRQVLPSGGTFPVSLATDGEDVYVLNALEGGSLQGFHVFDGRLVALPGSARSLGLNPSAAPQFTNTPGEVAFTPDGSQLVVTTKENGNDVDVFRVGRSGQLSAPVVNALAGDVPFAVNFTSQGVLLVTEAGPGALASFELREDGRLDQLDVVPTGQNASCWVTRAGQRFFVSNTGSASLTGFQSTLGGQLLSELSRTSTDGGPVDAAVADGGRFLYLQTGVQGIVDEFAVEPDGSLTSIGSATVPAAAGGEGIVAL